MKIKINLTTGKIILILLFLGGIGFWIYTYATHTYIRAEFQHLDPFPAKMPVYYKGYKLGTTSKNEISKDFTKTILYINLKQSGLHLPKNITAEIKNQGGSYYVELVFPEFPTKKYIKSGDLIKGKTYSELEVTTKLNQAYLVSLAQKGDSLISSATKLTDNANDLVSLVQEVINENREDLKTSTKNLKITTQNLSVITTDVKFITTDVKDLAHKANSSFNKKDIQKSTQNIKVITDDLTQITNNLIPITQNLKDTTSNILNGLPKIDTLIDKVTNVVTNLNEILQGLKNTLKQKFSGFRIMFGRAIK